MTIERTARLQLEIYPETVMTLNKFLTHSRRTCSLICINASHYIPLLLKVNIMDTTTQHVAHEGPSNASMFST